MALHGLTHRRADRDCQLSLLVLRPQMHANLSAQRRAVDVQTVREIGFCEPARAGDSSRRASGVAIQARLVAIEPTPSCRPSRRVCAGLPASGCAIDNAVAMDAFAERPGADLVSCGFICSPAERLNAKALIAASLASVRHHCRTCRRFRLWQKQNTTNSLLCGAGSR